jgi:DNA-binding IscR family transcriptional regulator
VDEGKGTDVLRGRDGALEGSPIVDSVRGAGGGSLLETEAAGISEG